MKTIKESVEFVVDHITYSYSSNAWAEAGPMIGALAWAHGLSPAVFSDAVRKAYDERQAFMKAARKQA